MQAAKSLMPPTAGSEAVTLMGRLGYVARGIVYFLVGASAAIAAIWPTLKGESIVLDLGASIGADAGHLVNLAAMGSAMASVLFGIERPTVGLLNIGVEEAKGLEEVREAGQMLREGKWPQFQYFGFVEGDDIGKGTVDVVVTEGFTGNIALKAAEGTARQLAAYLREQMRRTLATRLGYLLARSAFRALSDKMDPRKANGGVFLGLNGIVIKSHGGTDAEGFAYAVDLGCDMVRDQLLAKIGATLARHQRGNSEVRAHSASEDARDRAGDTRPELGSSARGASLPSGPCSTSASRMSALRTGMNWSRSSAGPLGSFVVIAPFDRSSWHPR